MVVGLFVYSLISRSGPLGFLSFMYAPAGVVTGQTFLAMPIVASLVYAGLAKLDPRFGETLRNRLCWTKSQRLSLFIAKNNRTLSISPDHQGSIIRWKVGARSAVFQLRVTGKLPALDSIRLTPICVSGRMIFVLPGESGA